MTREKYIQEWLKTKNEIEILKNRQYGEVYNQLLKKAAKSQNQRT